MLAIEPAVKSVEVEFEREQAADLLLHAISKTEMPRTGIPTLIPARGSDIRAVPVLDLAVWPSLWTILKAPTSTAHLPVSVPMHFDNSRTVDWSHFENLAFQAIGFTLELLWNPCAGDVVAAARRELCSRNGRFKRMFGDQPFVCTRHALACPQHHYHPFDGLKSHDSAAKGRLSQDFLDHVRNLRDTAARQRCCCGMLFRAGGSAPLDYILLVVRNDGKTCYAAYGDAKHQGGVARDEASVTSDAKRLSSR